MKTSFAVYRILSWQCFSFSSLTISSFCLLTSSVSDEKSAINLIEVPSIVHRQFFSCCFQDFFFVFILQLTVGVDLNLSFLKFVQLCGYVVFSSDLGDF